ncbi:MULTISPECIES: flagellar biosynthesis protein FlhF [unclassified Bacillus (in: firmicutes)]|uniref:flagellar biosynthesis protein FlhF n=1 Tax=unclassified Bacillus (in: firmicutes) TaxID=185979 RepID=UPI00025978A9|nr:MULTISPECIES: flagellar biosynthesis protein FlhF [unclassified Bacillus (in: firmicutes)]AFI28325.1 FlhF [Bacillus sp. JS]GFM13449.1 protein FlhF [Bacillus sp. FW1]
MKIKKFTAASMQEAALLIRKELGNEAVILNSKKIKKRKWFGLINKPAVEVIAVLDQDFLEKKTSQKATEPKQTLKTPVSSPKIEERTSPQISVQQEQGDFSAYQSVLPEPLRKAEKLLQETGIKESTKTSTLKKLLRFSVEAGGLNEENVVGKLQELLCDTLPSADKWQEPIHSKYIVLFGSTGAGKTTTLAKLAAISMLEKQKKIAFITTDTYRIAAVEQLKTYAELLQAPLEVCYTKEEFEQAKELFSEYDHVFVDTAGRNFKDQQYIDELKETIPFESSIQSFLVLSATAKYEDMKHIVKRFSSVPVNQFIFTKIDETTSLGSVFNILAESKIGVGFMTNGQNVPEDIQTVSPLDFVRMLCR